MDEVIRFRLNSRVKTRVEALISTTIEEWIINKLRTMAVYGDLAKFSVSHSGEEEEQKRVKEAQAVETERQRLITEIEA